MNLPSSLLSGLRIISRPIRFFTAQAGRCLGLLVLLCLGSGLALPSGAQSVPSRRVLVLLVPGLRADDLTRLPLPGLAALRAEGAAGWMVCRAARTSNRRDLAPDGRDTVGSLALTLGSGARALFVAGNPDANAHLDHAVAVGALGDLIHGQGWQTAVIGSDGTETADTDGTLLAMDAQGRVDRVQKVLRTGPSVQFAPYGKRDDTQMLVRAAMSLPARYALLVLVCGDLARADRYGPLCLPSQREAQRDTALRALDALLTELRRQLQAASNASPRGLPPRLYLLAPAPAASTEVRDRLAPLLVWGRDVEAGTLVSPSTRTLGVAVNTDFLPTLAAAFNLPPPRGAIGRAITVQSARASNSLPAENTLAAWRADHDRLLQSERLKDVYGGLPSLQMLLVLSALVAFGLGHRRIASILAVAIVALPLGMLLVPSLTWTPHSVWGAGVALTLFTLLFVLFAGRACSHPHGVSRLLFALFALLLLSISLDLLTGSHLLRQAWMSYSVLEGARFYGIGNEYMGAAIGAACILAGSWKQQRSKDEQTEKKRRRGEEEKQNIHQPSTGRPPARRKDINQGVHPNGRIQPSTLLLIACALLLLFLLGYNRFGAKVGAVPSAGMALGVEGLVLWRGRVRLREALLVFGVALLLLAGLAGLDLRHGVGEQSHLARVFAGSGGVFGSLIAIARRKLLLEGYLLLHSPWSATLLSASCSFWWLIRAGKRKNTKEEEQGKREKGKEEIQGISPQGHKEPTVNGQSPIVNLQSSVRNRQSIIAGLTAGSVVSLLCNDSGVTAAALIMLFGCAWALTQEEDSLEE